MDSSRLLTRVNSARSISCVCSALLSKMLDSEEEFCSVVDELVVDDGDELVVVGS